MSKSLSNIHIDCAGVVESLKHRAQAGQHREKNGDWWPFPPKPPIYTEVRTSCYHRTLYQTSLHCSTHSAAFYRIRRGIKRREKHLFNEPSPGCLSLPFRLFFCPEVNPPTTPSKPCTTDGSGSIHRWDLWSLIAGKWTRGWGCPGGRPPSYFL